MSLITYWEQIDWMLTWITVEAIATVVLVVGIGAAFWQVREARRSTNAQIAMGLFVELRSYETVEKLRLIYKLNPEDFTNYKDSEKNIIDHVLYRFDTLGKLVIKKIIDKDLAIETYAGPPALRFWYQLKDYIRAEQRRRGYYGENYENFARLCIEHFKKESIEIKFNREGEENKGIDLVTKLYEKELRPRSSEEIKRNRKKK